MMTLTESETFQSNGELMRQVAMGKILDLESKCKLPGTNCNEKSRRAFREKCQGFAKDFPEFGGDLLNSKGSAAMLWAPREYWLIPKFTPGEYRLFQRCGSQDQFQFELLLTRLITAMITQGSGVRIGGQTLSTKTQPCRLYPSNMGFYSSPVGFLPASILHGWDSLANRKSMATGLVLVDLRSAFGQVILDKALYKFLYDQGRMNCMQSEDGLELRGLIAFIELLLEYITVKECRAIWIGNRKDSDLLEPAASAYVQGIRNGTICQDIEFMGNFLESIIVPGKPRGTPLSPIIFLLYVLSRGAVLPNSICYAEGLAIPVYHPNINEQADLFRGELKSQGLLLPESKTEVWSNRGGLVGKKWWGVTVEASQCAYGSRWSTGGLHGLTEVEFWSNVHGRLMGK